MIATKRELADAQQLSQLSEGRILDGQEQLEMVMLDKEMAEERAETAELEVEELKEKLAVLQVEMGVLKGGEGASCFFTLVSSLNVSPPLSLLDGGTAPVTPVGSPEKTSLAYIQLEKQNERLKEALIK